MSEVTTEKLIDDLKIIIDDAEELIKASADSVGGQIAEARRRLGQRVETSKAALAQRAVEMRERAEQAKAHAIDLAQDEGWRRLALAACLGVLVGLALRYQGRRSANRNP